MSLTARYLKVLLAAPLGAALLVGAGPQENSVQPAPDADARFVAESSAAGLGEVHLARLAQKQGNLDSVRRFAIQVASEAAHANTQLSDLANQNHLSVATSENAKDGAVFSTLTGLSGPTFDGVYISAMVSDHRDDVTAFEKEVETGKNQQIKDFASSQLPVLREHLRLAEKAAAELNPTLTDGH
jgi:putative membrane protein